MTFPQRSRPVGFAPFFHFFHLFPNFETADEFWSQNLTKCSVGEGADANTLPTHNAVAINTATLLTPKYTGNIAFNRSIY